MKRVYFLIISFTITLLSCSYNSKPKILVIGDSISIGYAPFLKNEISKFACVKHIGENAGNTKYGLSRIDHWISSNDFDIVLFNWGLWDLTYRLESSNGLGPKDRNNGTIDTELDEYVSNVIGIVEKLLITNAKLYFVTTTFVPGEEPGMFTKDVSDYNARVIEVMKSYSVDVIDIYYQSKEIHRKYGKGLNDVHYTPRGYQELSRKIAHELLPELATYNQSEIIN